MGTDWKLLDDGAQRSLDLQGFGAFLQTEDGVLTLDHVRQALNANGSERSVHPWKGIWAFIQEAHAEGRKVRVLNEHHDDWEADRSTGWARFSVYARTGHHKRKGYGPIEG